VGAVTHVAGEATRGPSSVVQPALPRCRANSRRGLTDPAQHSYPPVEAVQRGLEVLRTVNGLRIASVSKIHAATGIPRPTIVRMLETLIADGYVVRDNLCGGYRVTARTRELHAGYDGISQVIEASRPWAIELTRRTNFPVAIGALDGDAISLRFWTGTISPLAHTNTVLGLRPDLMKTAMGRAYLAFSPDEERERLLQALRANPKANLTPAREQEFRDLLARVRRAGYATRAPQTEPARMTTVAMPIRANGVVVALMGITFFSSGVLKRDIPARVLAPLRATVGQAEDTLAFMQREHVAPCPTMLG
jgi:IclR family transcriptional regulator, mhp operon transcriptional activator